MCVEHGACMSSVLLVRHSRPAQYAHISFILLNVCDLFEFARTFSYHCFPFHKYTEILYQITVTENIHFSSLANFFPVFYRLKMAEFSTSICEYETKKIVYANCGSCNKSIGEFREFEPASSRKFWNGKLSNMDWNIKFVIDPVNKNLLCDCGKVLGEMLNDDDVKFSKKSIKLNY